MNLHTTFLLEPHESRQAAACLRRAIGNHGHVTIAAGGTGYVKVYSKTSRRFDRDRLAQAIKRAEKRCKL